MTNNSKNTQIVKAVEPSRVEEALRMWREYCSLVKELEGPGDFVSIRTKDGTRKIPTKKWTSKMMRAFGLSVVTRTKDVRSPEGTLLEVIARARVEAGGRWVEEEGRCDREEVEDLIRLQREEHQRKFPGRPFHAKSVAHLMATIAVTRAINRAVNRWIGVGEVTAEEISAKAVVEEEFDEGDLVIIPPPAEGEEEEGEEKEEAEEKPASQPFSPAQRYNSVVKDATRAGLSQKQVDAVWKEMFPEYSAPLQMTPDEMEQWEMRVASLISHKRREK